MVPYTAFITCYAQATELRPAARRELRRLQALLLEHTNHDTAEDLFSIVSAGDAYPGRITLQLICLPVMG